MTAFQVFFWLNSIPLCIYVTFYLSFSVCGHCEWCFLKHESTYVFLFLMKQFHFFGMYTQQWGFRVMWNFSFQFLKKLHTVFHNRKTDLHSSVAKSHLEQKNKAICITYLLYINAEVFKTVEHWHFQNSHCTGEENRESRSSPVYLKSSDILAKVSKNTQWRKDNLL